MPEKKGMRTGADHQASAHRPAQALPEGFEPPTPGSEDQCSDPLSYGSHSRHAG